MKSVAFACSGEGRGHVSRVLALSDFFYKKYRLSFFCPSTVAPLLREKYPDGDITEIPYLELKKQGHTINYPETIAINKDKILGAPEIVKKLGQEFEKRGISAIISDFEPFSVHTAALRKIPVINLNHPGIVIKHFSLRPEAIAAQMVSQLMMPPAQENLICSFYDGDVGPILRKEIRELKPTREDFFLVYAKKESRQQMLKALEPYDHLNFRFFPNNADDFTDALGRCRGVIAPSGHQLLSEALSLKKPVLAFPQKGQYEQYLNGKMLIKSGWGLVGEMDNPEPSIKEFLHTIDDFPRFSKEPQRFILRDSTMEAVVKLENFIQSADIYRIPYQKKQLSFFSGLQKKRENINRVSA